MDKLIKSLTDKIKIIDLLSSGDVFLNIEHYGNLCYVSYSYLEDYDGAYVVGDMRVSNEDLYTALLELNTMAEAVSNQFGALTKNKILIGSRIPKTFYDYVCIAGIVAERKYTYVAIDEHQRIRAIHNIGNTEITGASLIPINEIKKRYFTQQ